jgi:hypothetical protein
MIEKVQTYGVISGENWQSFRMEEQINEIEIKKFRGG